jgi:hypothetical protein
MTSVLEHLRCKDVHHWSLQVLLRDPSIVLDMNA